MTLPTEPIDIPLSGGVDEGTQAELVGAPSFTKLTNLRQIKRGSYQKRYGNTMLSAAVGLSGGSIPTGKRLIAYKNETLMTDGRLVYSRVAAVDAWRTAKGYAPQLNITRIAAAPVPFPVEGYDIVQVGSYLVLAWSAQTKSVTGIRYGLFVTIVEASSGVTISAPVNVGGALTSAPNFRLVMASTAAILLFTKTGSGGANLWYSKVDTLSSASIDSGWSAAATLATDVYQAANANIFDGCSLGGGLFAIAYPNNVAPTISANTVTVRTFDSSMAQQASTTIAASAAAAYAAPLAVGIDGRSTNIIWVTYPFDNSTFVAVIGLNPTTLAVTATPAIVYTTASATGIVAIAWTGTGTGTTLSYSGGTYIQSFNIVAGAVNPLYGNVNVFTAAFDSRPFVRNSRVYATFRINSSQDPNQLFLVDLTATLSDVYTNSGYLRPVGNIAPRLSGGPGAIGSINRTSVVSLSSTKFVLPTSTTVSAGNSDIEFVTLDWGSTDVAGPCLMGEAVFLSGAMPSYYDGVRVAEVGFIHRPKVLSNTVSGGGGLAAPSVGYNYVAVYEHMDACGQWHQSSPSDPYLLNPPTAGGNLTALVTVSTLCATNRVDYTGAAAFTVPTEVRIVLYRTTDGGTQYRRLTGSEVNNDPSVASLVAGADTGQALGPYLYTQPGTSGTPQVKVTPPALISMIAHGDRVVGANGKSVWFSGQTVYGEAAWFADLFQFPVESPGDITALASMDGALVIFKRDAIAFVDGQGPPDNGAGSDFTPPSFLPNVVGCIDSRSVVVTPDGIMFQSTRGLELLTRKRQLAPFFGDKVQATVDANPFISSAVLDQAMGTVTFTCSPSANNGSCVPLTYDYQYNVWTLNTVSDGNPDHGNNLGVTSVVMASPSTGAALIRTWLDVFGRVHQETPTNYQDFGRWVTCVMETAWIKGAGVAGLQMAVRAILQSRYLTAHDLIIEIGYDYNDDYLDSMVWTAPTLVALATKRQTLECAFTNPECTAFRIRVTDGYPTQIDSSPAVGTGQGAMFFGLQVDMGQNGGLALLPEANRK